MNSGILNISFQSFLIFILTLCPLSIYKDKKNKQYFLYYNALVLSNQQNHLNIMIIYLTLMAFMLANAAMAQECLQTCIELAYNKCNICYNKCLNPISEQKTLIITQCSQMSDHGQLTILNNGDCVNYCCQKFNETPFTLEVMNECMVKNQVQTFSNSMKSIIIYSFVGAAILLIGIYIYCICLQKWPNEQNNDQQQVGADKCSIKLVWENLDKDKQKLQSLWNVEKNSQEECAICLDFNCTLQTDCGHYFHTMCLLEWMKRSKICPDCRAEKVKPLKIVCSQCRNFCLTVSSNGQIAQLNNMFQDKKLICDKCRNIDNTKNESFERSWVCNAHN